LPAPFHAGFFDGFAIEKLAIDLIVERKNEAGVDVLLIQCFGRAPETSANPPVFAKGTASEVRMAIRMLGEGRN
jgi:hypothetical protein